MTETQTETMTDDQLLELAKDLIEDHDDLKDVKTDDLVKILSAADKKKENVSYLTLKQLLNFFKHGVDMMGFKLVVHGWFPKRGIKDVGHLNRKQLLTKITDTWPGTVIIGWGHEIHFYGFQKSRGKNGEQY